jgi:hypothetical protein
MHTERLIRCTVSATPSEKLQVRNPRYDTAPCTETMSSAGRYEAISHLSCLTLSRYRTPSPFVGYPQDQAAYPSNGSTSLDQAGWLM